MKSRIATLAGIAGLVFVGTVFAQEHQWEFSPEAGYLFGGSMVSDRDAQGKNVTGSLENAGVYGLRAAYLASPNIEFEIQASRTDARFVLDETSSLTRSSFRTDYLIGSVGYRFKVGDAENSIARVSLGAGASRLEPGEGARVTRFTGAVGAGFVRYLYTRLGFRLDGRVFASRLSGISLGSACTISISADGGPSVSRPCNQKSWLINSDVTAGLVLGF